MTTLLKRHTRSGLILVDILLALSLAILFIAVITGSSFDAQELYARAHEKMALMDQYESDSGLVSKTHEYGNERLQDIITVASQGISSTSAYHQSLEFVATRMDPTVPFGDFAGSPLCGADLMNGNIAGSYSFMANESSGISNAAIASITPIALPVNPSLPLTDLQVRDGIAYISADSAVASDPDALIVDIHDPTRSTLLSSINTGPGLSALTVAGNRIYGAADSTAAQLHIIRINTLNSLTLERKYKLPLPYATATPPVATSIAYENGKIYQGTGTWDGNEFSIIDVSNPLLPNVLGGLKIGAEVEAIVLRDSTSYIATAGQQQFITADIHDSSAIAITGSFSPSGWQRQQGNAISSFEQALNVGRTSGGFDIPQDHELFSWATSSDMGTHDPVSLDIPGGVYGIVTDEHHIYAATRTVDKEFMAFDPNLSSSTMRAYSLPIAPQAMTCDGDELYILAHNAPYIYEISFTK